MLSMLDNTPKSKKSPLVSIIMPAYNSGKTIRSSIQSVCRQTYSNWELLIVDDCSDDNIESIIQEFQEQRIHYYRLSTNQGVAAARNKGVAEARGQYLAFLDSDDLWHPDKLTRQVNFMQKYHYAFTYTWYQQFSGDIHHLGNLVKTKTSVDYKELLKGNDIGCLTVMIDRSQIPDVTMPSQRHEDYITWLNILKQGGRAYSLPISLAAYRKGKGSLTNNKWKSLVWTWKVYRNSQQLSLVRSGICMFFYVYYGLLKHL